jgi:hypothetical protein
MSLRLLYLAVCRTTEWLALLARGSAAKYYSRGFTLSCCSCWRWKRRVR